MPHTSQRRRGTAARLATATAAAALIAASVTGIATAQSADTGSANTKRATTTHDNLTVTHEVIGSNIGLEGDEIHYRTTISATDGPARQVTGIAEGLVDLVGCYATWTTAKSGTVTYTNNSGERVSESMPRNGYSYPAVGSWTVDPAAGTTVVYDTVREFNSTLGGFAVGCDWAGNASPSNIDAVLTVRVDGLDTLDWRPTGVTATCASSCLIPGSPAGSLDMVLGSALFGS
ncbi:hypothetical protein SAMN05444580_107185 [Rhodococcus tukisamuensis]|uniref:Uncharacterized protein n=1 Tax=Rhodococcus tukisamuensis TaxID=168276 RepID=A0A1G6YHI6_9NOCA|nr:hypothetical protein SAMN05444580_107185 [Rhodococcus tukisamuensis]